MINYQSGIVSPPSERIKKLPVQVSSPILPKSSHTTSPYVTLKRFTSATSEALEESQDIDGNNNQREEWITKAQTNISSPLLSSENYSDELTVSPYKRRHNMQEITGNILTKSETISSDESEPKFVEPIVPSNNPSCNSGISLPIIVKISSLSPQTIQLLQKCVERGYMILQCKDDFVPYTSNNSDILITLVESQKTRQGLSLCKRTLTYLKVGKC